MTTATDTIDRKAWDAALSAHRASVSTMKAPFCTDIEADAACDKEGAAWFTLINTPAPDIEALAIKLIAALDGHVEGMENATDPDFLTRVLDEGTMDGGMTLVRVLQDAIRIGGLTSTISAVVPTREKPWPEIAAAYRMAMDAHAKLHDGSDDADDWKVQDSHTRLRPLYKAVIGFAPTTAVEMAEKAALLLIDLDDGEEHATELRVLAADAARLAGSAR